LSGSTAALSSAAGAVRAADRWGHDVRPSHHIALALTATLLSSGLAQTADAANGRRLLSQVGLWTQIERRGNLYGYYSGELIKTFNQFDPQVGHTVAEEAGLQLDKLKSLGVNHILFELRTADASTAADTCATTGIFPSCTVCTSLGPDWPQPTAQQLAGIKAFFDLVASKGLKIDLLLTSTHMEQAGSINSKKWFGSIFDTVKGHPALKLIVFGGDKSKIDTNGDGVADACGSQGGEPPLWLGPKSYAAKYLKWVMLFAMSRGISAKQLSAESAIGDFFVDSEPPAGPDATDHHLWKPIRVMKAIFDDLKVPNASRIYAMSFYSRFKCSSAQHLTCTEMAPHQWAEDRLQDAIKVISPVPSSHMVATEVGTLDPKRWPAERAYESIGLLLGKYRTAGGNFWRWTSFSTAEDNDPKFAKAVKKRGIGYVYLPPQRELVDLGGFHLTDIPNGSFESGGATPTGWAVSGSGTGKRYRLAGELGQPRLPTRGSYSLRLVTGASANATIQATSRAIAVTPRQRYTTTANLRFRWTGDPNPGGAPETRPQVFIAVKYLKANGQPSAVKPSDTFRYFQNSGAADFQTFPIQYVTPADSASVKIIVGAARHGLPHAITLDADNFR
jgi:hypothetical protein